MHQAGLGPLGDGLGREAADQIELDVQRMAVAVHRDGSHKRHLVLGASPGLATRALTAEISVVQLHGATQAVGAVLLGHGAVDSLMQQPRGGLADAQLALERQRGQPGLGLADEVDAQEPSRQRQFGGFCRNKKNLKARSTTRSGRTPVSSLPIAYLRTPKSLLGSPQNSDRKVR